VFSVGKPRFLIAHRFAATNVGFVFNELLDPGNHFLTLSWASFSPCADSISVGGLEKGRNYIKCFGISKICDVPVRLVLGLVASSTPAGSSRSPYHKYRYCPGSEPYDCGTRRRCASQGRSWSYRSSLVSRQAAKPQRSFTSLDTLLCCAKATNAAVEGRRNCSSVSDSIVRVIYVWKAFGFDKCRHPGDDYERAEEGNRASR
jgi:hypothetical protein